MMNEIKPGTKFKNVCLEDLHWLRFDKNGLVKSHIVKVGDVVSFVKVRKGKGSLSHRDYVIFDFNGTELSVSASVFPDWFTFA